MGLLAPLYVLAALAIAGPVLLHLIRRQPQGEQQFSSLMFLKASPPTLTRRSRIENWLLLLMRSLAIALIAFAFARPYFRQESLLNVRLDGRRVYVLMDTSASMQRDGVWDAARDELQRVLGDLSGADQVALFAINDGVRTIVGLEPNSAVDPVAQRKAVESAAQGLAPTWFGTDISTGLTAIADQLASDEAVGSVASEVVLISDLHVGSGVEALQSYPWPEEVRLDVRQILAESPGNAFASVIAGDDEMGALSGEKLQTRVRIENSADAQSQNLEVCWVDANDQPLSSSKVQVPAGQIRVVPMPEQPSNSNRLRLLGDAWDDDNDLYLFKPKPRREIVAYVAAENTRPVSFDPKQQPSYFLKQAPLSNNNVRREVVTRAPSEFQELLLDPACRVIVLEPSREAIDEVERLQAYAADGGTLLVCLSQPNTDEKLASDFLTALSGEGIETIQVGLADTEDYALIGWVDFRHPVFKPFADPRFNDFTKIRFWHHYNVDLPTNNESSGLRVVAKFDDDWPMLVHQSVGKGNIWLLASGWQPEASGLALSTKFVPILNGLLDPSGDSLKSQKMYEVGERVVVPTDFDAPILDIAGDEVAESSVERGEGWVRFLKPGGYQVVMETTSGRLGTTQLGGVGELKDDNSLTGIAVQVPRSESDVTPLDRDVFEQYGIQLGQVASDKLRKESARQLQVEELEQKQRLWQWIILAGICILIVETVLSSLAARKRSAQLATAA